MLNNKKRMFYTGTAKKVANREVRYAIMEAKKKYKDKVELKFSSGNLKAA